MNFLSSALNSLTGSSIPYTLKEKIVDPTSTSNLVNRNSIWTVYNGLNPKSDQSPVTVFEFNLKDPVNIQRRWEPLARNAFKKLKLIKFPAILSVIDFIENDSYLYIVTEPVIPLLNYLQDSELPLSQDAKLCGLQSIAQALSFINMSCSSVHGNINISSSVFVTASGDWKLFGFELLTNLKSDPDQPLYRLSGSSPDFRNVVPDEVNSDGVEAVRSFPIKLDSYKYGAFAYQVLSTSDFRDISSQFDARNISSKVIPSRIAGPLRKLVNSKLNLRSSIDKYEQETSSFNNTNALIKLNKQLEDFKFQNDEQKMEFIKFELSGYFGETHAEGYFPSGFLNYKLLPELISQFSALSKVKPTVNTSPAETQQRQETLALLLDYILKFGSKLSEIDFNKSIKPIILETFNLGDRSIRLVLLTHLPMYASFLSESDIQSRIFLNLISGFQDTNFMIRETTLKSITIVIDKISVKQVNQDLLKVLAKSQMDPKPSIRVNTLILIIKISSKIYKNSKNNVLITALSKSLRDTFTPSKLTALSGFESLIDEFSLDEICTKILGHLAISLMDKTSSKVRKEAKRIFQLYLDSVEAHASTLPNIDADDEAEEAEFFSKYAPTMTNSNTTSNEANDSSNGGGALSLGWSMVNKFVGPSAVQGPLNHDFNNSTPDLTREATPTAENPSRIPSKKQQSWMSDVVVDDGDGWGGFDDIDDTPKTIVEPLAAPKKSTPKPRVIKKTEAPVSGRKISGLKLGAPTKKPISALKLDLTVEDDDSKAWDDDW
ncbi:predicted protein [Scheffersomyces stipitis CBS 6054]|uniref:Protein kinase domain-containing protein n=1 Tax=Scheffersomyces stipitis (strain ATCC 58785 / CBS 6054 / NBRC 10063 / NRRL Y-11545) TaxID=322104 RepID=A3LQX1_PICST|nr:predicted protein [Scheffersomyces stipitis CBS 6054]ABN65287.2 predicted protein [Scheffersomyces stipitis CBS 6054]